MIDSLCTSRLLSTPSKHHILHPRMIKQLSKCFGWWKMGFLSTKIFRTPWNMWPECNAASTTFALKKCFYVGWVATMVHSNIHSIHSYYIHSTGEDTPKSSNFLGCLIINQQFCEQNNDNTEWQQPAFSNSFWSAQLLTKGWTNIMKRLILYWNQKQFRLFHLIFNTFSY